MKLRRMIKQRARAALHGNRGSAAAMLLVCMGVSLIINLVDSAALQLLGYEFSIYSAPDVFTYSSDFFYSLPAIGVTLVTWLVRLALVVPLGYGVLNWYLELTDRRRHGVMHVFWPYEGKAAIRGILLSLNIFVKMTVASCLLLVLPLSITFAADMPGLSGTLSMLLGYSGLVLILVALLLLLAFAQRFAMARMLLCEKYELTTHQAIKTSVRFTKGHRWELVRFELSFLPWLLPLLGVSCMLTFSLMMDHYSPMPFVWTWVFILTALVTYLLLTPYYTMAEVIYTRYLYEYGLWQQKGPADPIETATEQPEAQPMAEEVQRQSATSPDSWEPTTRENLPEQCAEETDPPREYQ